MSFLELAKTRYSTRHFSNTPVSDELIETILEAARVAPTAKNLQPQRMLVIQTQDGLQKLQAGTNTYQAPLVIVVLADRSVSWKRSYDNKDHGEIDATIATDHMMLQAADLGLGSVWICRFDPKVVRQAFNIPTQLEPVNILAIGYEAGTPKSPDRHLADRKPLADLVVHERF